MKSRVSTDLFHDLYNFQKIQSSIYFHLHGTKTFASAKEAEQILELIRKAWNKHIAPRGKEIDAMTTAEKTELFQMIKIDFL